MTSSTVSVNANGPIAVVTIDNPPVNATSQDVRQGLIEAISTTEAASDIRAVVLFCAGRTFVAGADIREFAHAPREPHLPDVVLALEATAKPWIAAIHGTALGGGLELALGCAYRVAVPSAKLGLPEVNLGLIPGAGGTVRLPRLMNAEDALEMIATGKSVAAAKALELGLLDALAGDDLLADALAFAKGILDKPRPLPLIDRPAKPVGDPAAYDRLCKQIKRKARGQTSPIACMTAVDNALTLSAPEALAAERALFMDLKADPQSAALRHIFFAERGARRIPEIKGVAPGPIDAIGIVGGGTMGAGIASACLLAGCRVTMIERNDDALNAGMDRVRATLKSSLERGLISGARYAQMAQSLQGATDYAALQAADLIIEAVFEDMEVKHAVFAQLDAVTRPEAVLASNTSYLDINQIAAATKDPTRVIGLHFFSPAHIMKLLELVVTAKASPRAIATGAALGQRLGKITVSAGVCDGFIGNRVMSAYRRECDYLIEDGAMPADVDAAMREFGFPMGIFEMQDLAGLDIAWAMRKRRAKDRDPAERYVDIADRLCEAGRLGRKTGAGWYRYDGGKAVVDPLVEDIVRAASERNNIRRRSFSADEIMARILEVMQAEGAALLVEGVARSADDVDVVMVNGYGFPRWRGGPMFMSAR